MTNSWEIILQYGALTCVGISILILSSLKINPRLWLNDYPEPIRVLVPPLTLAEKRTQLWFMPLVLLCVLGIPYLAARQVRFDLGTEATFLSVYGVVVMITTIVNLWDALVLDLLVLTLAQPRFMRLPGTEHRDDLYGELRLRDQLRDFAKGAIIMPIVSLIITGVAFI